MPGTHLGSCSGPPPVAFLISVMPSSMSVTLFAMPVVDGSPKRSWQIPWTTGPVTAPGSGFPTISPLFFNQRLTSRTN